MTRLFRGVGLALAVMAGAAWAGGGGKIAWGSDYEAARASAQKSGKLLMIYFTADW